MPNRCSKSFCVLLFAFAAAYASACSAIDRPAISGDTAEQSTKQVKNLGPEFADWDPETESVGAFRDGTGKVEIEISFEPVVTHAGLQGRPPKSLAIKSTINGAVQHWRLPDTGLEFDRFRIALGTFDEPGQHAFYLQRDTSAVRRKEEGVPCCNFTDMWLLDQDQPTRRFGFILRSGNLWGKVPIDLTGDGRVDIVTDDAKLAALLGDESGNFMPPRLFGLRGGEMVDVSREPDARFYYRGLISKSYDIGCRQQDNDNVVSCAYYGALAALAGTWPRARHLISRNVHASAQFPSPHTCGLVGDAQCTHADLPIKAALRYFGYLPPTGNDSRNWVGGWLDFHGRERDGAIPLDVQQFIYDIQGCGYYGEQSAEQPNGETNEAVVDMIEEHCRDIDDEAEERLTEETGFGLQQKYRDDPAIMKYLKFPFNYPDDDSWGLIR